MNLKMVFKISGVLGVINGIGFLFMTSMFFEMANLEMSPSASVVGQFTGMTLLALGFITWRLAEVSGEAIGDIAKLLAILNASWVLIIGFHVLTGQVSGPTPYINIVLVAILATLFWVYSNKSE